MKETTERDADRGGADDQVRPVGGLHAGYTQLRGLCQHERNFYIHYGQQAFRDKYLVLRFR